MAVKRKGHPNHSKENLTWKLNVLAAKTGEDTHIEQAKRAALGKRHQGEQSENNDNTGDQEKYLKELHEVKKKKLETKLFHIRKEIKTGLKKSRALETTKQSRKLRAAQEYVASTTTESTSEPTEKSGKTYTAQDVERFQKELDTIKTIDMEPLVERALNKFIRKNATLKKDDTLTSLLSTTKITNTAKEEESTDDSDKVLINNVEARLLGSNAVTEPLKKNIGEMELLLLDPEQRKTAKETKRKAAAAEHQSATKRQKPTDKSTSSSISTSSSLFMDSLGGQDTGDSKDQSNKKKKNLSSTDWEDPDFDKYYNGKGASEKTNRPGQSQRRRKWEALHGEKAKHLVEGKLSSREQRDLKKQKRLQREAARAGKNDNSSRPSNNKQDGNHTKKEENLEEFHPSWQAKRQQQEMMAKALSGKGAGNKIVFDDAD